ncbi:MAG: squalene synthase HpnC [Proteobacteria bacterium]|nr:squalene synthase HpnC [Pseudomonadota bacterium]MBI3498879.1 squalene synthase HpnC [Pseudomonadota bacterium]
MSGDLDSRAPAQKPANASWTDTASGKSQATENFPVASRIIAPAERRHVLAFYTFARAADDVADHAVLAPEAKLARLEAFAKALDDDTRSEPPEAAQLRRSLAETGVSSAHAHHLLQAFRQDATKQRYHAWSDLLLYCAYSAAPVGRYLLDLHRESRSIWPAADALCNALQVINHLQDCRDDHAALDRVYLPTLWFAAEGITVSALAERATSPALRRVLDRTLDRVDELLIAADPLPRALASRRLALQSAITLAIARRLSQRLRRRDPLVRRVRLGAWDYLIATATGVASLLSWR